MYRTLLTFALTTVIAGCGLLLDPDPTNGGGLDSSIGLDGQADSGAGEGGFIDVGVDDASPPIDCAALGEGAVCGEDPRQICNASVCIASRCGDGLLDPDVEACDDGNGVRGDGCEVDCTKTCAVNTDCDDGNTCNGAEQCTDAGCSEGTPVDGATCATGGVDGFCSAGYCLTVLCSNGRVDLDEECDDGNLTPGDGCEPDCTFTCEADSACPAFGTDCVVGTCDPLTHMCGTITLPRTTDCWLDEDGDGWGGAMAPSTCDVACPAGTSPLEGDCDDSDVRAHPFPLMRSPFWDFERVGGGFDYDCNGDDEKRSVRRHVLCGYSLMGMCVGDGWMGVPPECGLPGTFIACRVGSAGVCRGFPAETTMACR